MRFRILILLFCYLCLSALSLSAQHPVYRHYTVDDGLPSTEIYHVLQDSKGYIWLATNMGVSRYDGRTFKNFDKQDGLPENTVFEIYEDGKGRIWFISFPCQLSYFYSDTIHEYKYNGALKKLAGIGYIPVKGSFLVYSDESVYISFLSKGLFYISPDGKIIQEPSISGKRGLTIIEKHGTLLLSQLGGSADKKFVEINTSLVSEKFSVKNSPNYSYSNIYASFDKNSIYFAQNEYLYKVTDAGKVSEKNLINRVIYIYSDNKNNLWVGTDKSGIVCFIDGDIDRKPDIHYLGNYSVTSVCLDSEGGKWFSTIENGLFYLPSNEYSSFTTEDGLTNNKINDITLYKNQVIIGTHDPFINIFKNGELSSLKVSESINGTIFKLLNENNQKLWIGTNDYLYLLENDQKTKYINTHKSTQLNKNTRNVFSIKDLFLDSKGQLIIGESRGFCIFRSGKILYNSYYGGNIELRIEAVDEFSTNNYLLGSFNGLWRYSNGEYSYLGDKNNFFKHRITDILLSKSNNLMAIGTKGSGLMLQYKDTTMIFTKKTGLSSNSITSLLLLDNKLWVATNYGLNVIDISKIGKKDFEITKYTRLNGLISNEINKIAGDSNNIYIGTSHGLTVFNYKNYKPLKVPPPIYINAFRVMKQDTVIKSGYRLKSSQNLINIDFIGISFRDAGNLKYKYRLDGLNRDWNYTFNTQVEYAFLPPGNYEFEVIAINSDGLESENPASLSFTILPPFYYTWWFIATMILFLTAIAYYLYSLRLKQIKKENDLRNDINLYRQQALSKQMDPHFVFNTLNSIQSFIIKNDSLASTQYLSKFAKLIRLILNNSQNQAVPLDDEISALTLYLELESLRFQKKFKFELLIDPAINSSSCFIPAFLIQPFVENAVWHGIMGLKGTGHITVELKKNHNEITCIVEDNGIGRAKSMEMKTPEEIAKKSFGIKLVEQRLELLNNLYDINMKVLFVDLYSENGKPSGTRVIINLPMIS